MDSSTEATLIIIDSYSSATYHRLPGEDVGIEADPVLRDVEPTVYQYVLLHRARVI